MLELLFQGFIEWIYGLILECWEYFASVLFDLMSLDFAYLREHIPIIDTIRQIMLGVAHRKPCLSGHTRHGGGTWL